MISIIDRLPKVLPPVIHFHRYVLNRYLRIFTLRIQQRRIAEFACGSRIACEAAVGHFRCSLGNDRRDLRAKVLECCFCTQNSALTSIRSML